MLYITFIIQKCMSVVSDFICLLDRSVVSDAGLARLRSVVSDNQRTGRLLLRQNAVRHAQKKVA